MAQSSLTCRRKSVRQRTCRVTSINGSSVRRCSGPKSSNYGRLPTHIVSQLPRCHIARGDPALDTASFERGYDGIGGCFVSRGVADEDFALRNSGGPGVWRLLRLLPCAFASASCGMPFFNQRIVDGYRRCAVCGDSRAGRAIQIQVCMR